MSTDNNPKLFTIQFRGVERATLSLSEASVLTGVPVSQFRKLARDGEFNPITAFGRKMYISAEDLVSLVNRRMRNESK